MLAEERQRLILERLKENESIRIADLCTIFSVTRETIRRDLYELEAKGLVKKVHGGAILDKTNVEPPYLNRQMTNVDEKDQIALEAANYVDDGDAIFIDIGTTTLLLARHLKEKKGLTVITNSLPIAIELSDCPEIKVILPGGELRGGELSLSGSLSRKSMEEFYVDKAFIGVAGLSAERGITDYHLGEADIRKMMLKHSEIKIALADYSKFNVTALIKIADLNEIDMIITDEKAPKEIIQKLEDHEVKVVIPSNKVVISNNFIT